METGLQPCWRIDSGVATVMLSEALLSNAPTSGSPGFQGQVTLDRPDLGIEFRSPIGAEPVFSLWRRSDRPGPREILDAYVRGGDLVVRYAPTSAFPFEEELRWRWLHTGDQTLGEIELVISVQTDLLDTAPAIEVESLWKGGIVQGQAEQAGHAENPDADAGLVWLEHHSVESPGLPPLVAIEGVDRVDLERGPWIEPQAGGHATRWRLLGHFLEKGVIRRARLGFCLAEMVDGLEFGAWREAFVGRPAVLTT